MKADSYQTLSEEIRSGNCLLFLGPLVTQIPQTDDSFQPASPIGGDLVVSTEKEKKLIALSEFYEKSELDAELHPVLKQLINLPFKVIINFSPDDFLARHFSKADRNYHFYFYNFRKPETDSKNSLKDAKLPLIYNLLGYYKEPESLVLTHDDLFEYLKKGLFNEQHKLLPDKIFKEFNEPPNCLFLGFEFETWYSQLLLKILSESIHSLSHSSNFRGLEKFRANKVNEAGSFRFEVIPPRDVENFISKLNECYFQTADKSSAGIGKSNVAIEVKESVVLDILLDRDFDSFGEVELNAFIKELQLQGINPKILEVKNGSVRITLKMSGKEAEILFTLIKSGKLKKFGVTNAATLEGYEVYKSSSPAKSKKSRPKNEEGITANRNGLKEKVAADLESAIEEIKKCLNGASKKHNDLHLLKGRFETLKEQSIRGVIEDSVFLIEKQKISQGIITCIDCIPTEDFI